MFQAFTPAGTVATPATVASATFAMPFADTQLNVMVTSEAGGSTAFIRFGGPSVVAALTDTPILPGSVQIFRTSSVQTHIAVITGAATATMWATTGDGL